jgi:hypothetical protein
MFKKIILSAAVFALSALAADVTGKWTAEVPGRQGNTQETTFNLKADGGTLTGTVTNRRGDSEIKDGKVDGDNISFVVVRTLGDNEIKQTYKGAVSGDTIKFTRTVNLMATNGPLISRPRSNS